MACNDSTSMTTSPSPLLARIAAASVARSKTGLCLLALALRNTERIASICLFVLLTALTSFTMTRSADCVSPALWMPN